MKKLLALILALCFCLSLTACGDDTKEAEKKADTKTDAHKIVEKPIDPAAASHDSDVEEPKVEEPKVETPVDTPKVEAPVEEPKVEAPVKAPDPNPELVKFVEDRKDTMDPDTTLEVYGNGFIMTRKMASLDSADADSIEAVKMVMESSSGELLAQIQEVCPVCEFVELVICDSKGVEKFRVMAK